MYVRVTRMESLWKDAVVILSVVAVFGILATFHGLRARGVICSMDLREDMLLATSRSGKSIRHLWGELREVTICVDESGPFDCDVHWELRPRAGAVIRVPQDLSGADQLLIKLQQLPSFDNMAVADAMLHGQSQPVRLLAG